MPVTARKAPPRRPLKPLHRQKHPRPRRPLRALRRIATSRIFKIQVNEVPLIFTVTDRHGHYIPNLNQNDFALLDNQRAPAKVDSFHQQINLPLRVGIVIDASSSIRSRFQFEQQSAIEFLLQVLKAHADRAFVMGFDVTPTVTADWTNDMDALEAGVDKLSPGGGTALFDAVYTACRPSCSASAARNRYARPSSSSPTATMTRAASTFRGHQGMRARRHHHLRDQHQLDAEPWPRRQSDCISSPRKPVANLFPPYVEDMAVSFKDIEQELRSQYALVYTPADFKADGSFRTIYLYCYDRRYQVHARKGYFATGQ